MQSFTVTVTKAVVGSLGVLGCPQELGVFRIMEYPRLGGTPRIRVQLLALKTPIRICRKLTLPGDSSFADTLEAGDTSPSSFPSPHVTTASESELSTTATELLQDYMMTVSLGQGWGRAGEEEQLSLSLAGLRGAHGGLGLGGKGL